jgi:hypothetical protein
MRLLPFSPRQQRDYRDDVIGVLVGSQYPLLGAENLRGVTGRRRQPALFLELSLVDLTFSEPLLQNLQGA